ncbi:hypothetical protein KKH96_03380 [Patescibacteria group bacterium]|nr:hypothetical protein [Patescibacteria group bacterium]
MNIDKIVLKHNKLLIKIKNFLEKENFRNEFSSGLIQPRFNYTYSPSAAHHIIDDIIVFKKESHLPIDNFYILPDRSIRVNDAKNVGISSRHLSFFELLVFGSVGAAENLSKEKSVELLCNLMFNVLGLDKNKILVTILHSCEAEGIKLTEEEDEIFYNTYINHLGKDRIFRTIGQRNLFYSRIIDNPGSTGCEIYYKIGNKYIEIGSHVNYKFKFTGQLKRTRNQAVLEGFGFERLLMALENKDNIYDISLIFPLKKILLDYFKSINDNSINLFEENLNIIIDHIRTISFIIFDGQELDNSSRGRILKRFIKNLHGQFVYLGVNKKDEFKIINKLINVLIKLFSERYNGFSSNKNNIINFIKRIIK